MIIRYSHILFIIILSSLVYAGDIDSTWWQASYELGLRHLQAGNTDSAEIQFSSIIKKDDTFAKAYYGLALVSLQEDSSDEDAEDNLRKAVKLNPKLTDAWIELALFMERNSIPPSVEAFNILAAGLRNNPNNKDLYERFIAFAFWNSEEGRAVSVIDTLLDRFPVNMEIRFDLARLYYNLGNFEISLAILNSLDRPGLIISICQLNLLRAKNCFKIDQLKRGFAYYWQAVNSIKNVQEKKLFLSDIQYIISDIEYEEFERLNVSQMRSFFDRFWRSRNPHLANDFNKRIPEHYNRIFYARKHYRRYIHLGDKKSNFKIYKFSHPHRKYGVTIGDTLLSPLVYKPLAVDRDLDDMGLIYVRHGEPDNRINHLCEDCILNFSWHYYKTYNRPEMIFHFIQHGTSRGWMMESIPTILKIVGN